MAAALEGEGPAEAEIDERFEYDAPRFYDFDEGSPAGAPADGWFDTEGPKGEGPPARLGFHAACCLNVQGCRFPLQKPSMRRRLPRLLCRPGDAATPRRCHRAAARAGAPGGGRHREPWHGTAGCCARLSNCEMEDRDPCPMPQSNVQAAGGAAENSGQQGEAAGKGGNGERWREPCDCPGLVVLHAPSKILCMPVDHHAPSTSAHPACRQGCRVAPRTGLHLQHQGAAAGAAARCGSQAGGQAGHQAPRGSSASSRWR